MGDVETTVDARVDAFTAFVSASEPQLRAALSAAFGGDVGREATADALAYGWEHWDRVSGLDNPAGYLFEVGRNRARRLRRRRVLPWRSVAQSEPWIEPGLAGALNGLSRRQRTVVLLVHGYGMTLAEVGDLLGLSKSTVQNHAERGLGKLQRRMGVST